MILLFFSFIFNYILNQLFKIKMPDLKIYNKIVEDMITSFKASK